MIVGIIGGGQLGMMMAVEALALGHVVYSYDPSSDCPIVKYSEKHTAADFTDVMQLEKFCSKCDVITYEFENIPYQVIEKLESKFKIYPNALALKYSQNRYKEKSLAKNLNINTASFKKINSQSELYNYIDKKYVLKSCSGGYDGKGQFIIDGTITEEMLAFVSNCECIIEDFIAFDYEVSVLVTRDLSGNITSFPVTKNIHKNGILHMSIVPAQVSEKIMKGAILNAVKLIKEMDFYGSLAVEYFVTEDTVYFNEMAPRPHNSFHHTLDSCDTSQFLQHIKIVTGSKTIQPKLLHETVMVNILGQDMDRQWDKGIVYMYDKQEAMTNRKMGHVNFINNNEYVITKYRGLK